MVTPTPTPAQDGRRPGLSSTEAAGRLQEVGPNEIRQESATPAWRLFVAQFSSPLVVILLGAAAVSVIVGGLKDAAAITVIVTINGVIGFVQESRAEKALLALRSLTASRATVIRDGVARSVEARTVVPGDQLLLQAGDVVAADGDLLEVAELTVVEATLTGESEPVRKSLEPSPPDAALGDRHNAVFMGTTVAAGTARAVVTATGMKTELGRIAHMLTESSLSDTPLQRRLATLGRVLLLVTVVLVAIVGLLGWLRGLHWYDILMTTVSLAVSVVPEGLPAVVTVAMAVGVRRLAAQRVLVRRLSAVETLGCVTVICTDKTGTLTTGIMTVRERWGADVPQLLRAATACCDAELDVDGKGVGDPTELAILRAALEQGIDRADIEAAEPRTRTQPFDPDRRYMAVWRGDSRVYVKGALEALVPRCTRIPEGIEATAEALAGQGLRVLAVAVGDRGEVDDLELLGLLGLADAPRAEALAAVKAAQAAGVHVVMITGDHALTAEAIARELGILQPGEASSDVVFARKTAADKTEIVQRVRARGEVVAMTGDGVNDAPSIREADIGIALGQGATQVTREAADMVLTDDDLGGVVSAIREGRIVYDNIRKTVIYLLSGNASGLIVMIVAVAVGWPLPLLPLHLLWLNIMSEPLPGLALAVDPPHEDVMSRGPRAPSAPLLNARAWGHIGVVACLHAAVALGAFSWGLQRGNVEVARTLAFSSLVFGVLLRSFAERHPDKVLWEVGFARNAVLFGVVAVSMVLQLTLNALPVLRDWFHLAELSARELGILVALGFIPVTVVELSKLVRRLWARPRPAED